MALQYKRTTYHRRPIPNTIPVFTYFPHHLPLLSSSCHLCFTVPSMAPRTRQSQTKGSSVSAMGTENERPIPLETSNLANVNTSTRSRVPARRVIPGNPNQCQHAGTFSLNCRENRFQIRHKKHSGNAPMHKLNPKARPVSPAPHRLQPMLPKRLRTLVSTSHTLEMRLLTKLVIRSHPFWSNASCITW